jgi:capsular polysaccharide biosynthesis protein
MEAMTERTYAEAPGAAAGPAGEPSLNGERPERPRRPLPRTAIVVGALTVLGAAAGALYAVSAGGSYQSHAYVLVSAPPATADNGSAVGLAHAYAKVALQPAVVGPALAAGRLPSTAADVRRRLTTATSPDAPVIEIVGRAPNAAQARALADTASRAFVDYLDRVGRQTGYRVTLLSAAGPADAPRAPGVPAGLAGGALVGSALGAGWRLLRI